MGDDGRDWVLTAQEPDGGKGGGERDRQKEKKDKEAMG